MRVEYSHKELYQEFWLRPYMNADPPRFLATVLAMQDVSEATVVLSEEEEASLQTFRNRLREYEWTLHAEMKPEDHGGRFPWDTFLAASLAVVWAVWKFNGG